MLTSCILKLDASGHLHTRPLYPRTKRPWCLLNRIYTPAQELQILFIATPYTFQSCRTGRHCKWNSYTGAVGQEDTVGGIAILGRMHSECEYSPATVRAIVPKVVLEQINVIQAMFIIIL
jgi:hypothetical protein